MWAYCEVIALLIIGVGLMLMIRLRTTKRAEVRARSRLRGRPWRSAATESYGRPAGPARPGGRLFRSPRSSRGAEATRAEFLVMRGA